MRLVTFRFCVNLLALRSKRIKLNSFTHQAEGSAAVRFHYPDLVRREQTSLSTQRRNSNSNVLMYTESMANLSLTPVKRKHVCFCLSPSCSLLYWLCSEWNPSILHTTLYCVLPTVCLKCESVCRNKHFKHVATLYAMLWISYVTFLFFVIWGGNSHCRNFTKKSALLCLFPVQ